MFIEKKTEVSESYPDYLAISTSFPVPLLDPQEGKPAVGFRTFTTGGELIGHYCSPVCGSPTWQVWDLILSGCHHLAAALSLCSFFLSLDVVYLFWWVPESSSDGCWTTSLILVFSEEEDKCLSFYLPSWTRSLNLFSSLFFTPLCVHWLWIYFLSLPYFLFLPFFFNFFIFSFTVCLSFRNV